MKGWIETQGGAIVLDAKTISLDGSAYFEIMTNIGGSRVVLGRYQNREHAQIIMDSLKSHLEKGSNETFRMPPDDEEIVLYTWVDKKTIYHALLKMAHQLNSVYDKEACQYDDILAGDTPDETAMKYIKYIKNISDYRGKADE